MINEEQQIKAAIDFIRSGMKIISEGNKEDVIRHNFTSYLRLMFPDLPGWVERHISGTEATVKYSKDGELCTGFVDNLIELTAIEYESDISSQSKYVEGYNQLKSYCASLVNKGNPAELIRGVLSDTIRWRAYKIKSIKPALNGIIGGDNVELEEIETERIEVLAADAINARLLIRFLNRHLGRLESRYLNITSISEDLGFESKFCEKHIIALRKVIDYAFKSSEVYGDIVKTLWCKFVSYLREENIGDTFDIERYTDELYVLTLAKLICANIIEKKALLSDDRELQAILDGSYFKTKGFVNLVEYDYFGWLNSMPLLQKIIPIARAIQNDLKAYDFEQIPFEDIFGQMFTQLAKRKQRLLLGQECTPTWLAKMMVEKVVCSLPKDEKPKLIDMCCGSGTFIVEALKLIKSKMQVGSSDKQKDLIIQELSESVVGIDIDPLAVILSKVNWIIVARDLIESFGAVSIVIPIYHSDSLFAITPLSKGNNGVGDQENIELQISDANIKLPVFLISPDYQQAFDCIIDTAYRYAMSASESTLDVNDEMLNNAINEAVTNIQAPIKPANIGSLKTFLRDLSLTIDRLNKQGKNGIWAFIIRNSYRPGLLAKYFNGLISNPPWLALSKIADNPYKEQLKLKAEQFGINPSGSSFLHVEMATIFLLNSVNHYLKNGAQIACILPDSVLNGTHHEPFRAYNYASSEIPVDLRLSEIWRIEEHTFKNKAIVLFGQKTKPIKGKPNPIPGGMVSETGLDKFDLYRKVQGARTAWSEDPNSSSITDSGYVSAFRQGADIMPRMLFFYDMSECEPIGKERQWNIKPIDISTSPIAFIIKDAKKEIKHQISPCVLPDRLLFDILTSNLLMPFSLARPVKAILPIKKNLSGMWEKLEPMEIAGMGNPAISAIEQIGNEIKEHGNVKDIWELINTRSKLSQQIIDNTGYLVFAGTSGSNVCSAFVDAGLVQNNKLIVDQTLNWAQITTIDEALYLTGLLNSEAVNTVIKDFQPEGQFGRRHIHSLPFRATPIYDETKLEHQDVVSKTKNLLSEFNDAKTNNAELIQALNPNWSTLARRRSIISKILKQMPSYASYDLACKALYGV